VWLSSVALLFVFTLIAVIGVLAIQAARDPNIISRDPDQLNRLQESPPVVLASVLSTVVAHLVTFGICWLVITRGGKQPLLESVGWRWRGPSWIAKTLLIIGVVVLMTALLIALENVLPKSEETLFDRLLKTSYEVRLAVAVLAVTTAPIVEEFVYRGVLYSALKARTGVVTAVVVVTILFAAVHFLQYWGAWSAMIGLTILSFTLTFIRAHTKSLMPCVAIHLLFNLIAAIAILLS
jgi:membrane protease YdiL (CAAX protease family)